MRPHSILLVGAVCAAIAAPGVKAAAAQEAKPSNPLAALFGAIGLTPQKQAPMPDFVRRSRPPRGDLHYLPVWSAQAQPANPTLSRSQIREQEAELETLRAQDERRAGRAPTVYRAASAAGPARVAKRAPVRACRITCKINMTGVGPKAAMR